MEVILVLCIIILNGFFWMCLFSIVDSLQKIAKALEKMETWERLGK